MIAAVSVWTPFLRGELADRWFSWPGIVLTSPVPVLVALLAVGFYRSLARGHEVAPFFCALGWFVLCFAGLGISMFPMIAPPSLTIWDAAAPRDSQLFLLVGAGVMIPIILAYTGYAYWLFRGKVHADAGYH
jgi:cytochrome d ubiquinol oxidase subunit II